MKQFETNVNIVMTFLKEEAFSPSVISSHRLCYQSLQEYLSDNGIEYTPDVALHWIDSNKNIWNYRKYTGNRHCVDQLNDVYLSGMTSPDHLSPRFPVYTLLSDEYKETVNSFISDTSCSDDRYRIACSRFLYYMQNNGITDINCITYESVINFHYNDYHRSSKSKDTYEDLIRVFLRYLALQNKCDIGLSLALNKLLIDKIIKLPPEGVISACINMDSESDSFSITWPIIEDFLSALKQQRYGKTVINSSEHILTLLYIFLQMHPVKLSDSLMWYWFNTVRPLLGSNYKQHRRSLYQFLKYIKTGKIITSVASPETDALNSLPDWAATPLKDYLALLKREGWQPSTITMQRSSNLRFCKYLVDNDIHSFAEVTPTVLNDFNLHDNHHTAEGKAAYNCRIRSFIIYLYEQNIITNAYLYKALPTIASETVTIVKTLSNEEVSLLWSVNPDTLRPKELRDYAMVCIGLTMGFRACDIVALCFQDIDWKNKSISIIQKKTGKLLTMPLPVKTGNVLYRYIRDARPQSNVSNVFIRHEAPYDSLQKGVCRGALKRFLNLSHDSPCSFHKVRKTFATQLLNGNTKTTLISDSLGHSTDGTVHRYLSLDEDRIRMCAISMSSVGISYEGGAFNA